MAHHPGIPEHFLLERVDGQSILTKQILAHVDNTELLSRYSEDQLQSMSDFQIAKVFKDVGKKPKIALQGIAMSDSTEIFYVNTKLFLTPLQQTGLENTIAYLRSQ